MLKLNGLDELQAPCCPTAAKGGPVFAGAKRGGPGSWVRTAQPPAIGGVAKTEGENSAVGEGPVGAQAPEPGNENARSSFLNQKLVAGLTVLGRWLVRLVYRVRVEGLGNLPPAGGVYVAVNSPPHIAPDHFPAIQESDSILPGASFSAKAGRGRRRNATDTGWHGTVTLPRPGWLGSAQRPPVRGPRRRGPLRGPQPPQWSVSQAFRYEPPVS